MHYPLPCGLVDTKVDMCAIRMISSEIMITYDQRSIRQVLVKGLATRIHVPPRP